MSKAKKVNALETFSVQDGVKERGELLYVL
jgi:hypothetical protein